MSNIKCDACGKIFQRKASLIYHITNRVCNKAVNSDDEDENEDENEDHLTHVCKICSKKFTTATSMYRHMRGTCKVKKHNDELKKEIYEGLVGKLEKEISSLKSEIAKLKRNNSVSTKTINNKSINNGYINNGTVNNTNIILVGYGKEDMSKLSKTDILKALQNGYHSTIKLTEAVHFNPKYPEYHNVYISNMKDKYAMMFDGKKWTLTTKEELINQIYEDKKSYIEENLEEFVDSLTVSRRQALKRWLDTDDEDPKIKEIKENIKLLLYNSRKLIRDIDYTKCNDSADIQEAEYDKADDEVDQKTDTKIAKRITVKGKSSINQKQSINNKAPTKEHKTKSKKAVKNND
ncbi:hypothetical protein YASMINEVIRUS_1562 [Yasminevirus sp. GU-2018]|uniref:C2H2-type domain-containing protein n=1 Tax=Yasminevirus sp. GU-2018 TaxID=2420051 RepID=A0A5K0UBK8_9VIRU|nr:hypothetical protein YASMINEVIRUS_1562 [Yasminevirus sp. GU-2018]